MTKLITCAREVCAGRCDVTNTERSPQTLPQTQKPSRRMKAVKEIDEREERIQKAKERGEKIEGTKADDVSPDAEQSLVLKF